MSLLMTMGDISFEFLATTCIITIYYTFLSRAKMIIKASRVVWELYTDNTQRLEKYLCLYLSLVT